MKTSTNLTQNKMKILTKRTQECVSNYNRSTNGLEVIQEVSNEEEAYTIVNRLEDADFFPQDDGVVLSNSGNEVYDPNYPDRWDFSDYVYRVEEIDPLNFDEYKDAEMIRALEYAGMKLYYTNKEIADFINENISLVPNNNWTIYRGENGLVYTSGSWEYRDNDHVEIFSFMTGDEIFEPITSEDVEFQRH